MLLAFLALDFGFAFGCFLDFFLVLVLGFGLSCCLVLLLDLALEQQAYKVEHNIPESLNAIAEQMGFLRARPRDVVELHSITLKEKTMKVNPQKAQAYSEEGRLMVLRLMGYLVSFYRKYSMGSWSRILVPDKENAERNKHE